MKNVVSMASDLFSEEATNDAKKTNMGRVFSDIGGAYTTQLLLLFSSTPEIRSDKRTLKLLGVKGLPTITSRLADLSHINKQN